jgi:putative hemin transport protein
MAPALHAIRQQTGSSLREAWDALRSARPGIRPREAARALGVSEAELVATACGHEALRLRSPWPQLLAGLAPLGRVVVQTRNSHAILEQRGVCAARPVVPQGPPAIDVRGAYDRWFVGYATRVGGMPQLAFYDRSGTAAHKVFVVDESRSGAWEDLARSHAHSVQSPGESLPPSRPSRLRPDAAIDASTLRTGWAALKGTEGIDALLDAHRATRLQGLRVVGSRWAARIPSTALLRVLRQAAVDGTPLTLTVANRAAAQSYRGPLQHVYASGRWLNARALDVSLQVRQDRVVTAWVVRAPLFAGMAHALEFFDAAGDPVLQLTGVREGSEPEPERWLTFVGRLANLGSR